MATISKIKVGNTEHSIIDTNTAHSHSAGVGLTGSGNAGTSGTYTYKAKLRSETALTIDSAAGTTTSGRVYPVAVDKSGYLSVNVPWTNTTYTFNGAISNIKDNNLLENSALISDSNGKIAVSATTSTELGYLSGATSNIQTQLNGKLNKLTYEWNKQYNAGGTAGYLLIGSFPMYDTNVTIDIDATTNTTYHGTVVIATQNVSETSIGTAHVITVYGDPTGTISDAIRVVWNSGSRNYNVYFVPATWSKNFIHIRAIGNYMENIDESKICTQFTTGTAPATTSGLTVVNALTSNFNKFTYTHPSTHAASMITGLATVATSGSYNDLSNKPTIPAAYSLPAATSSALGGVKIGNNITYSDSTISLTKANVTAALGYIPPTTDTNTHYTTGITAGASGTTSNSALTNPYIKIKDDSTHRSQIQIKGGGATTVSSDANGVITISSTDTNTQSYAHQHTGETLRPICINFDGMGTSANHGGYLDFFYNDASSRTSRICEYKSGLLTFESGIVLNSSAYGTSLPTAGNAGRIFFKKA